jgi:hypothetical protein
MLPVSRRAIDAGDNGAFSNYWCVAPVRRVSRRSVRPARRSSRRSWRPVRLSCRRVMPTVCASASDPVSATAGTARPSAPKSAERAVRRDSISGVVFSFMSYLPFVPWAPCPTCRVRPALAPSKQSKAQSSYAMALRLAQIETLWDTADVLRDRFGTMATVTSTECRLSSLNRGWAPPDDPRNARSFCSPDRYSR